MYKFFVHHIEFKSKYQLFDGRLCKNIKSNSLFEQIIYHTLLIFELICYYIITHIKFPHYHPSFGKCDSSRITRWSILFIIKRDL